MFSDIWIDQIVFQFGIRTDHLHLFINYFLHIELNILVFGLGMRLMCLENPIKRI